MTVSFRTDKIVVIMEKEHMKTYELTVPCHFGLESVLKKEIYDLGYEISEVELSLIHI